jgi:branched-chain amino acid transport system substrate-binding protein
MRLDPLARIDNYLETSMKKIPVLAFAVAALFTQQAWAQIKVAQIAGVSGPFANVGEQQRKTLLAMFEEINAAGGMNGQKLELVTIDGKGSPQESLNAFKQAVDQNIRFITQGNSSAVGAALSDAVAKYNQRNPATPVLYLNHSAIDNDLTNAKCNFWHFRFDPNVDMKVEAITSELAKNASVKSVYLINQNYALGQQASAAAKRMLPLRRADIKIVGDDLHPFGQVKDFSSYAAKIKASGADAVLTGNWGNDLSLLVKALKDANLDIAIYTIYGSGFGAPTAIKESGIDHLKVMSVWNANIKNDKSEKFANDFRKKYGIELYFHQIRTMVQMFAGAANKAKSNDPKAIAYALEGMKFQADTGGAEMRKSDHQIQLPMFLSTMKKTAASGGPADVKYDAEGTGTVGFQVNSKIEAAVSSTATSCQMVRP